MSSTVGIKKTTRRFKDLFKSKSSQTPSPIRETEEDQNETIAISKSIHRVDTPKDGLGTSPPGSSKVPTSDLRKAPSPIVASVIDDGVDISSSAAVLGADGRDGETVRSEPTQSNMIKTGLGIAGRFAQTLLKKMPDCIDSNPVKMALSIVKTIILIKDEIGDNEDALTEALQSTRLLLDDATGKVELEDSQDVRREIESYKRKIGEQNAHLLQITQELESSLRYLDYENYKKKIIKTCKIINETTTMFMLNMQIEIRKTTANMYEQMKEEQKERRMMSLQGLNPSRKADHKTILEGQNLKRETCTEGTRTKILEDITLWANDGGTDSPRVFWLTGQAGSGKTTIIYTIAKRFERGQHAVLGSSFLCSRQFDETRSLSRIIPTIAYQLAGKCEPYQAALHDCVKDKSAMVDYDVSEQIEELVVEPWKAATFPAIPATYLIVIDALDEINDTGGSKFLSVLLTTINTRDLHNLKFLVTSRTDPQIVQLCDTFDSKTVCRLQDVLIEEAEADVERYLDTKLPNLVGNAELAELRKRASGLFIYAATLVRILTTPRSITQKEQIRRLSNLLSKPSSLSVVGRDKSPIDSLYEQILYDAFSDFADEEDLAPRLRILFTFICAAERISTSVAAALTNVDDDLAISILNDLHAVLYIQQGCVFWYHASFPDFLMEQSRSNFRLGKEIFNYWCDQADHHSSLASSCFRIMASKTSGLKFNMGGIPSSYLLDSECFDDISTNLKNNLSPALEYACLYWGHHISSSNSLDKDMDRMVNYIYDFLQIRVLFWIEVMNLLKTNDRCGLNLHQARGWVLKAGIATLEPLGHDLLESANFATYFASSPASESTPHLYISSLATWKPVSTITKNWRNQFSFIPLFTYGNARYDVPLLTVGLEASIDAVASSNDGSQIVVGSNDSTLQVIDASTGQTMKILRGHTDRVNSVLFSTDDKWIVSGANDDTVRLWDRSTGVCLKVFKIGHVNFNRVTSVAISTSNMLIASGSSDNYIRLWDVLTGSVTKIFKDHTNTVTSVSFSMDNTKIASGSDDHSVKIWEVSSGRKLMTMKGHTGPVNSVAYTTDGAWVVSASDDMSVRVWDAVTGVQLAELWGHSGSVMSVAYFAPAYILSGSWDGSVRIWDATTGCTLKILHGHNSPVLSVGYSNSHTTALSGSQNGLLRVWSLLDILSNGNINTDGNVVATNASPVNSVGFSNDGMQVILGSDDGSIHLWDLSTHHGPRVLKDRTEPITAVAFSKSGSRFGWASAEQAWVWDSSRDVAVIVQNFQDHRRHIICFVAFLKDEKLLTLSTCDYGIELWDESTGVLSQLVKNPIGDRFTLLGYSQDAQQVVLGTILGEVTAWDLLFSENLDAMNPDGSVVSVVLSDNASCIASGGQKVSVWETLTQLQSKNFHGRDSWVFSVAFMSDNTRVVAGLDDSTVRVWDAYTGKEFSSLQGRQTGPVRTVAVSSNSRFAISGSEDGSVIIWDLEEPSWYLSDTNWVLSSPQNHRLMWVPPDAQLLQRPNCRILVGESLYSTFDFERAMLAMGPTWEKCYTPNIPSVP